MRGSNPRFYMGLFYPILGLLYPILGLFYPILGLVYPTWGSFDAFAWLRYANVK